MNNSNIPKDKIDKLIINSPYEKPKYYWKYDRETKKFSKEEGRRQAGYIIASPQHKGHDDPGEFRDIELVNQIRPKVNRWHEDGWRGASSISKQLLRHWYDDIRDNKFFFCQLEAIETLIWFVEAPKSETQEIIAATKGDGGDFIRLCCKMATGSGKTIVMAMIISWQILNKVSNLHSPDDKRFSKNILVVAPGLTVKNRLEVLLPENKSNYYEEFNIVPDSLKGMLIQGRVIIHNWHKLAWESEEKIQKKLSVDKRGAKSDKAYTNEVLGIMKDADDLVVINDEAHHAWRVNIADPDKRTKKENFLVDKEEVEKATVWINGLDRLHKNKKILWCFDMSATPFPPTGGKNPEKDIYKWIISDFGLNDAIESGLVKTPRIVIRDNSKRRDADYKSRLYHIYMDDDVRDDLKRSSKEIENDPLPSLVSESYNLLASDWKATFTSWKKSNCSFPPAMITVANNVTTSSRIRHAFASNTILVKELCETRRILQIDSKVLKNAEKADVGFDLSDQAERGGNRKQIEREELLRKQVSTVGVPGEPGEQICNIISVAMLSEGWDAKNVTHIMGLRAFSSQLLCEQVVGRGLRRTSYEVGDDGLFQAEHVNIFGIPFAFLPHEEENNPNPMPIVPKTRIEVNEDKEKYSIEWPNIVNIAYEYREEIELDIKKVAPFRIDPSNKITNALLAPQIAGKTIGQAATTIDMKNTAEENRLQQHIFIAAKTICTKMNLHDKSNNNHTMGQIISLVYDFINAGKIEILKILPTKTWHKFTPDSDWEDKAYVLLSIEDLVEYIYEKIKKNNVKKYHPIYDSYKKVRSTNDMPTWYTGKPCAEGTRTHVSSTVFDSRWEDSAAYLFDNHRMVKKYVKNDKHVGFGIFYRHNNIVKKYIPDYIVEMTNGEKIIIEVKGQKTDMDVSKEKYLEEWVQAVNDTKEWGIWRHETIQDESKIGKLISSSSKRKN